MALSLASARAYASRTTGIGGQRLPRDARDTLLLLAVIGWTVLPHLGRLPVWCGVLTAAVLLWRGRLALTGSPLPGRWVLASVLLVAAALTFWSFKSLLGKEPGVTLAVVLMALKTLELRARRDAFVVFFLGFFLILTHFLYSQSLPVAVSTLISIWGLLTALVLAHMPSGTPSLRAAGTIAGKTALLGAPLMALMFVLFPRVGPLWGVPQDGAAGTGLSNTMRMGSVTELALDDSIALRVRFDGPAPPPRDIYFRGPVLGKFDGSEWTAQKPSFPEAMTPRASVVTDGPAIGYEVTLEPLRLAVIPMLEFSSVAPAIEGVRTTLSDDLQWQADRPIIERVRFRSEAHTQFRHGPTEPMLGLQDYIDLPPGFNPRTLAWAAAMRRDPRYATADGATLSAAVLEHIRTSGYSYTLTPGLYGENDPRVAIDEFWLDRKLGFCEHFAAAYVVVMRALDVPARVVTGYQGLDPTPVDGYRIVRQSYAHAWAEFWQPGVGWVRADPTSAVAPDRVLRSRSLVAQPGFVAGALGGVSPQLLAHLRNAWEAVNNRWNQWVLNYSRGVQLDLMERLGFDSPDWEDLALMLIASVSLLSLGGAGWAWWDRHRQDPWVRQMDRIRGAVRQAGVDAADSDPPRTLARRLRLHLGNDAEAAAALLERLDAQRYGRDPSTAPDARLTKEFIAHVQAAARAAAARRAQLGAAHPLTHPNPNPPT